MKQILYNMGPLTLVRWLLYRALKVWHTPGTRIQAEKGLPTQKLKKSSVLRPRFSFLVENQAQDQAEQQMIV